jgi:hypothetical protein
MRASRLEVPPQPACSLSAQRRHELLPDDLVGPVSAARHVAWNDDPQGLCQQSAKQRRMPLGEHAELVEGRLGDQIH